MRVFSTGLRSSSLRSHGAAGAQRKQDRLSLKRGLTVLNGWGRSPHDIHLDGCGLSLTASFLLKATEFWSTNQPGTKFAKSEPGSREFFAEAEEQRYALEPHIPEIAHFEEWAQKDVLDVGCGIATDGIRFARAGARYLGIDASPVAVELARRRFELEGLKATIVQGEATQLPFADKSVDLVWSHGVIHHIERTGQAVAEFHRVLRPGGIAIVMLYHRRSFNFVFTIMGLRRILAPLLLLPGGVAAVARMTGEAKPVLESHRQLLLSYGLHYLVDRELFLSNNTDGPGNPLSKAYTRSEGRALFQRFAQVETAVRYLNTRVYPGGRRFARSAVGRALSARVGWHLYVRAVK
jgi:SAM-dependent methyltransferase